MMKGSFVTLHSQFGPIRFWSEQEEEEQEKPMSLKDYMTSDERSFNMFLRFNFLENEDWEGELTQDEIAEIRHQWDMVKNDKLLLEELVVAISEWIELLSKD